MRIGTGVAAAAFVAGFLLLLSPLHLLFSAQAKIETLFSYDVKSKINTKRPTPFGIEAPFSFPARKMTTLHLSAWVLGPGSLSLLIENKTKGTAVPLSHRPVMRHVEFDLTPHLKVGDEYQVALSLEDSTESSACIVQEMAIKQMPRVSAFPRLDLLLIGLAAILLFLKKAPVTLLIFAVAFSSRWHALAGTVGHPLEGDAVGYYSLVHQFQLFHPFSTGIREPLYIWTQYLMSYLLGTSELVFRLTTALLSAGCVVLTFYLCAYLSKRTWAGVVAAALMSFGDFVVWNSTRGERGELYSFLLLLFCLALVRIKNVGWKSESLLGVLAGFVSLTWLIGGLTCFLAYICRWVCRKVQFRNALLFFTPLLLMILPHLHYQWKVSGDALHSLNAHTNFYKNASESGTPSYEGPHQSLIKYILVDQGPKKIRQMFGGYIDLFFSPQNPFNKVFLGFHYTKKTSYLLFPFLMLGIILSIYERKAWIFLLLFSVLNISVAFIGEVRDPRLFLHSAFFFAYFFGVGVDGVSRYLQHRKFIPSFVLLLLLLLGVARPALARPITFNLSDSNAQRQIIFESKTRIEYIVGVAESVTGTVTFDPEKPGLDLQAAISVSVKNMKTGNTTRDGHLRSKEWLDAERHPGIHFDLSPLDKKSLTLKSPGVWFVRANGKFLLKGVSKEISLPVTLRREKKGVDDIVSVEGSFSVYLEDHNIYGPLGMNMIGLKVSPEVRVRFHLVGIADKGWDKLPPQRKKN